MYLYCEASDRLTQPLWKPIKYEGVYVRGYDTMSEAKASLGRYITFYNARRPHSSLDGRTPDHVHLTSLPPLAEAA